MQFIEMIVTELNKDICYDFTIHMRKNALDYRVYVSNNARL